MGNVLALLALAALTTVSPQPAEPTPMPSASPAATVDIRAPKAVLHLEIADTESSRERGLMDRTVLPLHTGMLFVFDRDAPVDFWMKDTRVSLDMIFIAADGLVRHVASHVPVVPVDTPDDKIPHRNGIALYVIELAAGEAAKDGIVPGTHLPDAQKWDPHIP